MQSKELKDNKFKNQPFSFPEEQWQRHSNGEKISDLDIYKPDLSFKDQEGNVVCVIESSSTGDRKVNIGELLQAHKFFSDNGTEGILIISLCGASTTSSTAMTLKTYLTPYFNYLKQLRKPNVTSGLKYVYLIQQNDFELLNWQALNDDFKSKANLLS